jgi:hypothetical protein
VVEATFQAEAFLIAAVGLSASVADFPVCAIGSFFLKYSVSAADYPTQIQGVVSIPMHMRISACVFRFDTLCVPLGQTGYLHEPRGVGAICDLCAVSYMGDINLRIIVS